MIEEFVAQGLLAEAMPPKLHMTLINTRYRHGGGKQQIPVNLAGVFERFEQHPWGSVRLDRIAICRRSHFDAEGAYTIESHIALP